VIDVEIHAGVRQLAQLVQIVPAVDDAGVDESEDLADAGMLGENTGLSRDGKDTRKAILR
jgi:hypothetical protein